MSTTTTLIYNHDTSVTVGSIAGTYDITVLHNGTTPDGDLPTVNLTTGIGGSDYNILSEDGAITNFDETFGATSVYQLTANGGTITSTQTATLATENIVTIENGGVFNVGGSFLALFESSSITFGGLNNILNIEGDGLTAPLPVLTLGTNTPIYGFSADTNDVINDAFINFSDVVGYSISTSGADQTVDFLGAGATDEGSLTFTAGTFAEDGIYNVAAGPLGLSAGAGGELSIARCFFAGTCISTPDGNAAVENLKRGDLVITSDGRHAPIRWVGRNTVSRRFADPLRVLPIRIKAGALADNLPERDLLVSPEHALFVDGVLLQAGALVNGLSITREADVPETFTYFHIELSEHTLILAEGIPAETFIDNVDRMAFDNWAEHAALYPDPAPIEEMPYPRAQSSRQVPVETRRRLQALAQETVTRRVA